MSSLTHRIVSMPMARSVVIAALLSATSLAVPPTLARADGAASAPTQLAQALAAADAATRAETVETRITALHASLKITPDEDAKWNNVAQAMRDNAAAMAKLAVAKSTIAPQSMTAVQDLKGYETYAQAHVDGLKTLISSFETLYDAMPDPQKKVADEVFRKFGRQGGSSHS